jgi:hypothetical protein
MAFANVSTWRVCSWLVGWTQLVCMQSDSCPSLWMLSYNAANIFHRRACDGNATATSAEYRRWYPNLRIPNPKTVQRTLNTLLETGSLPSVRLHSERNPEHQSVEEENILGTVQRSPHASTRRLARCYGVTQSMVWRTLNEHRLHPYHLQKVQHLQPGDWISATG